MGRSLQQNTEVRVCFRTLPTPQKLEKRRQKHQNSMQVFEYRRSRIHILRLHIH